RRRDRPLRPFPVARAAGRIPIAGARFGAEDGHRAARTCHPRAARDRGGGIVMKPRLPLVELVLCALCLWAAWYHTPAGALVRTAGAWVFRTHTTARPLLAYYGAGTLVPPPEHALPLPGPVPPAQALAYGAFAVRADLGAMKGAPVRAVADGIVRRASTDGVNGRILVVDHGGGVVTSYCHNDELLVGDGDDVRRGQMIARSGNTGRSTGPHLHYQLDLGGEPVDPLRFRAQRPKTAVGASD